MNKRESPGARGQAVAEVKASLRRFAVELLVASVSATESVGLNSTDLGTLCLLRLNGPTPAGRIAELTGVTTGAMTGIVDRLAAAGFVRRDADAADRRKVIVTPIASRVERDLLPRFPSLRRAAPSQFYDDFSLSELDVIARFLARLSAIEE